MVKCEIHAHTYVRVAESDFYMAGTNTRREYLVLLRDASPSGGETWLFLDTLAGPSFLWDEAFMVFSHMRDHCTWIKEQEIV